MRVARALAAAFLDANWRDVDDLTRRGARTLDVDDERIAPIAVAVLNAYRYPPIDQPREVAAYVATLDEWHELWRDVTELHPIPKIQSWPLPQTGRIRQPWPTPWLNSVRELRDWLDVPQSQLDWFADIRSLERRTSVTALQHYRYVWRHTRRGQVRLLEAPKPRLRQLQRRLLREILDLVPAHDAAHGFVRGRSARTFAAPHVDRDVVAHLDLESFFPSLSAGRIFGVWRTIAYAEPVAHLLTGLATTTTPLAVRRSAPVALRDEDVQPRRRLLAHLAGPHLAQGAPTSPALANLTAWHLDMRLTALAEVAGATYTRYADDLALSLGGAGAVGRARRLMRAAADVVRDEGFRINPAKSVVATRAQRQLLTGVVVNVRPSVRRDDYDRLRASLHNCRRFGPDSQNRSGVEDFRAHMLGRISWVTALDAERGRRLRAMFDEIDWA